jgi:hypothetical protein
VAFRLAQVWDIAGRDRHRVEATGSLRQRPGVAEDRDLGVGAFGRNSCSVFASNGWVTLRTVSSSDEPCSSLHGLPLTGRERRKRGHDGSGDSSEDARCQAQAVAGSSEPAKASGVPHVTAGALLEAQASRGSRPGHGGSRPQVLGVAAPAPSRGGHSSPSGEDAKAPDPGSRWLGASTAPPGGLAPSPWRCD